MYDPYKFSMPIPMIDKQTRVLQAIMNTLNSAISEEAKLNWIEVITRESMKEFAPEIEAIKKKAMADADHGSDKFKPGDVVGGY